MVRWENHTDGHPGARAHHERGLAQLLEDGPRARFYAAREFERAAKLEPDEPLHALALAWTQARAGFSSDPTRLLENLLEDHPQCRWAHLDLARLLAEQALHYQRMESGPIRLEKWGQDALDRALRHYREASVLGPEDFEPWVETGELLLAWGDWSGAADALQEARSRGSPRLGDLLLATAFHWMGKDEQAEALFRNGMSALSPEEFRPYFALPPGVDSQADPLLLTRYNERQLEHYARVTLATLCFSHPSGVGREPEELGWQTDRGQTLIRYGLPKHWALMRPEVIPGEGLVPPTEQWDYGKFDLLFEDSFLNGRYPFLDVAPGDKSPHFRRSRELLEAHDLARTVGQLYADPYATVRDSLRLDLYRLPYSPDSVLAIIVFWVPEADTSPDDGLLRFDGPNGVVPLMPGSPQAAVVRDMTGTSAALEWWWAVVPAGEYGLIAEWGWDDLARVASHKGLVQIEELGTGTVVGDIVPVLGGRDTTGIPSTRPEWLAYASPCWPVKGYAPLPRSLLPFGEPFSVYLHAWSPGVRGTSVQWELLAKRPRGTLSRLTLGLFGGGCDALIGWEEVLAVLPGSHCRVVELDVGALRAGEYLLRLTLPSERTKQSTATLPIVIPQPAPIQPRGVLE
jgi:GWxTD domain-containing protein